jgi:hypothetical protein
LLLQEPMIKGSLSTNFHCCVQKRQTTVRCDSIPVPDQTNNQFGTVASNCSAPQSIRTRGLCFMSFAVRAGFRPSRFTDVVRVPGRPMSTGTRDVRANIFRLGRLMGCSTESIY